MDARATALLWDAIHAADAIRHFLGDCDLAAYAADPMLRAAVERQFIIIGEALGALRRHAPGVAARLPMLQDAVAFRHVLVHGYSVVTKERVWAVVVEQVPELRSALAALLDEAERPG